MSSVRPSNLVIDDDDWASFSPAPAASARVPAPALSRSSTSSGEYNMFSSLGSVIAGGGLKRELWFSDEGELLCLGKVGNSKFCIKRCDEGKPTCGTVRHVSKFTVDVNSAYIRATENQVFCSPCLQVKNLSNAQRAKLSSLVNTASEWERIVLDLNNGNVPEWMMVDAEEAKEVADEEDDVRSFDLMSPMASGNRKGIFEQFPSLSFDSCDSNFEMEGDEDESGKVEMLERKLRAFKSKLTRPFTDIEASYLVLISDLSKVRDRVQDVVSMLGNAKSEKLPQVTVWKFLRNVRTDLDVCRQEVSGFSSRLDRFGLDQNDLSRDLNNTMEEVAEMQVSLENCNGWMQNADNLLKVFQRRFQNIRPLLGILGHQGENGNQFNVGESTVSALEARIRELEQRSGSGLSNINDETESVYKRMIDLEEKIKLLENRVVGAGVQMGNVVFQSFEDLLAWVRVRIPRGRFGLIVDGHSFLEFFTLSGHIDTEAGTAAFSHSQKAGFATYIEAQLAISFKNLFPMVFGKGGSANLDDSECLPAIGNGDKWNNGSTGVHHQLMRNMNDVSYQLDSSIKKVFKDHVEAKQLAIDCVTASKRFVIDLISFMSQEYATWQQRGFTKKDAWLIVSQIVRRIFEDLQSARISARNVQDFEDSDFTTASFIYATLKCHEVMEAYVKHQFHAHPHVSSVITRHLAANFVKPDQSQESKYTTLENKVKALASKVDAHESKLKLLVDKSKKGKAKIPEDQS
jgi:hypothetical protein